MKNIILLVCALSAGGLAAAVKDFPWCKVDMPDSVSPGGHYAITVTPKKTLPAGCNLSVHMHHTKKSGQWGGLYEWRPSQDVKEAGKPLTFNFTAKAGSDCKELCPMMFVAPKGDFNAKRKEFDVNLGKIAYRESAEQAAHAAAVAKPEGCTYKKSWIVLSRKPGADGANYRKGDQVTLKVRYYLDPSEDWGDGTTLKVIPLGPWIDNPDGQVNKSRSHVFIHGFWPQERKKIAKGENELELTWKVESAAAPYCEIGFMAQFVGGDGKTFPWQTRGGGFSVIQEPRPFRVWAGAPGGLFRYGEDVTVCFEGTYGAEAAVKLTDSDGNVFYEAKLPVRDGKMTVPAPKRRGVALCEVTVGAETKSCFFGTIPDVAKALGGRRAPFGCTNISEENAAKAAALVGFRYCRLFTGWAGLEPKRGMWCLDGLDRQVDLLNANGISPHILVTGAPEWVMPAGVHSPGYEPYPFDDEGWREAATHLAKRYSGRIWGFEWLNEIVQGNKTPNPVDDYVRFCKIGTTAVKAVDPKLQVQMAGGLWPRNFRLDVLRAGIGRYIDVLPVHYSQYDGVTEALGDFAAGGGRRVIDNESARGYSVWNMPARKALVDSTTQSAFVLRQWPGEFIAGAESVIYFGGEANAAGNWTYLLDAHSPRPVAATLAVMASKLGDVRPVGAAYLEPGALAYLFEKRNGKGLAFLMSHNEKGAVASSIPVGATTGVKVTDYQGNESETPAAGGRFAFDAKPMPVIAEDFAFENLAAATAVSVAGQGPLVPLPTVRLIEGGTAKVQVTVRNPYRTAAAGAVIVKLGAAKSKPRPFKLKSGESTFFDFDLGPVDPAAREGTVAVKFTAPAAVATRRFAVTVTNPDLLGNLVKNGGFETAGGKLAEGWGSGGFKRVALDGKAPGYDGFAIEMRDNKGYNSAWQSFKLPAPGIRYLYTAWVWTDNMYAGSNASVKDAAGKGRDYSIPSCFCAPTRTGGWTLLSKVFDAIPGSVTGSVVPVGQVIHGQSSGWAKYDNVRVTAYEGTEYATEAARLKTPVKVDGSLADWDRSNPVPLCCENQITAKTGGYAWTRDNLSGVAYLAWDAEALYFAAEVKDDQHTVQPNADTPKGDAITLALHPGNRVPGTDGQAEEWFISDCSPGGGSGKYTLYRPASHSAGLKSGQLAKDSSVYEVCVKRDGDRLVYELRIPWSEIPGVVPETGAKLGLSLRLSDADGGKFGRINWGMGLDPAWSPSAFGVLTLTK